MILEKIIIREAQVEDASAIIEFFKLVTKETENLLLTYEDIMNISIEDEEKILSMTLKNPKSIFLVAVKGTKILGIANLRTLPKKRVQHRVSIGISIVKEYWGNGIGFKLLTELIKYAKSIDLEMLELDVRSDNTSAIHLYKKLGFKEYGLYKDFMLIDGKYYDGVFMNLSLKS